MNDKIPLYEAIYDPKNNKGVYGISLVESPAMQGTFIALKEEKEVVHFKTIDEEKRIVIGLVLEPNKIIYRAPENGTPYNMFLSEKTVEQLCYDFTKNQNNSNSNLEHSGRNIKGVSFVENWIVRDENMDTSIAFGLTPKKGQWYSVGSIDSDEAWQDYIKTGKVKGFSIEAEISLEQVNFKNQINMNENESKTLISFLSELSNKITLALKGEKEKEKIVLSEVKTMDGNVVINYEGDTLTAGGKVWIIAEDGTEVPLPVGDYELEDGSILVISQDGIIAEVKPVEDASTNEVSGTPTPASATAPVNASELDAVTNAIEKAVKSIMIKYSEDTKNEIAKLKEQVLQLSNQPSTKPIKSIPTQIAPKNAKERLLQTIQNS